MRGRGRKGRDGGALSNLQRALGRIRAGQALSDLPGSMLWALLRFYETTDAAAARAVQEEMMQRGEGSEHWRA